MSRPLLVKAVVVPSGVDIESPTGAMIAITASEALDLFRSLRRNLKRIRRNARLWGERL